jgi:hypothetical protein
MDENCRNCIPLEKKVIQNFPKERLEKKYFWRNLKMSFEPRETFLWPLAAFSLHVKLTDLLITKCGCGVVDSATALSQWRCTDYSYLKSEVTQPR